ncbi:hypothetical protein [Salinisphaera sp.]|uniref:hypothetical protein n=1 Tax=Salinisphaera sp. TaxID=1914330 RepID=UPI002D76FDD4|nr:hypothetical protein [Salinisphaera sp.]HET7314460.1 hypothetical protein [Salinisphaera sp.]
MRQFRPHSRAFAEDDERAPGWRVLHLGDEATIGTRVHRLHEPPARAEKPT